MWNTASSLRIAVVWNIPAACNRATADFMISSTLMTGEHEWLVTNYEPYLERQVAALVGDQLEAIESEPESADEPEPVAEAAGA